MQYEWIAAWRPVFRPEHLYVQITTKPHSSNYLVQWPAHWHIQAIVLQIRALQRMWTEPSKAALTAILLLMFSCNATAFAQTREADAGKVSKYEQTPEGEAVGTQPTVKNPYYNSQRTLAAMQRASEINQQYVSGSGPRGLTGAFGAVDKILTGERTNVVFQAAEQGQERTVQQIARNSLNATLGAINPTYTGMHRFFIDDIVGNLFGNIGQLMGRWISELINGWIADSIQYLAQFLRIFVLNPNVAVNGLGGKNNDGISPLIRQGADTMYGIACDLLLLLFILCIWRHWADAAWKGAGNLMAPVGRLIFTAAILLAWPTIYAFVVQISNEMIKAIYFNSSEDLSKLHLALATIVKGGLIASASGALSVFAPILGGAAGGSAGQLIGHGFYFCSLVVFVILGGILIAELIYVLILKAIQTALLVAQYMFAPIFLVFFASPSTENIAAGYVRAFVETSLWTFVWVGLLRVMVIVLASNFNPWGKILIAIGVLQLMIQVPAFLARAQISPMSDFISAGLVSGGLMKGMSGLSSILTAGISTLVGKEFEKKAVQGLLGATDTPTHNLNNDALNPGLVSSLNDASAAERNRSNMVAGARSLPGQLGPGLIPPARKASPELMPGAKPPDILSGASQLHNLGRPPSKKSATEDGVIPPTIPGIGANPALMPDLDPPFPTAASKPTDKPTALNALTEVPVSATVAPPVVSTTESRTLPGIGRSSPSPGLSPGLSPSQTQSDGAASKTEKTSTSSTGNAGVWKWKSQGADGWDESGLVHVPARKILARITAANGVTLGTANSSSIVGSSAHGVQRVNFADNASEEEKARVIYAASFADMIAHEDPARDAARRAAFAAGAHQPKGFKESLIANWLESHGKSWYSTPWAKENFDRAVMGAAISGSAAYMAGGKGNAYTQYLEDRFKPWNDDNEGTREALAIHYISNPESSESPWNRNIGPATENLIQSGIPISPGARGAMQNMAIQGMHPARRKQAVFAMLAYCFPQADALYDRKNSNVFDLALGEMCRALPAEEVNAALSMYQISGTADLNPQYAGYVNKLAGDTQRDVPLAYSSLAGAAPHVARQLGRLKATADPGSIRTISDLEANVQPSAGETKEEAFQIVMTSSCAALRAGELHGIPMKTVLDSNLSSGVYEFLGGDLANIESPSAHRKMQIVARNLSTVGTPNTIQTLQGMYTFLQSGGNMSQLDADHINVAAHLVNHGVTGKMLPAAVEIAIGGGYYSSGNMPIQEITDAARHYSSGQVSDYRLVPIVAQMANANIRGITNQTIRIAAETLADTGGEFNGDYTAAVIAVSQSLRNSNLAPSITETFVRARAEQQKIEGAKDLPLNDVLARLESRGYSPDKIASSIVVLQHAGGFSDHQLQSQPVVELMLQCEGSSNPHALQALNVVTKLLGPDRAASQPEFLTVTQEYLGNNGRIRDLDLRPLHALVDLDAQRQTTLAEIERMPDGDVRQQMEQKLSRFRIDRQTLSTITNDSTYRTGCGINAALWNNVFR